MWLAMGMDKANVKMDMVMGTVTETIAMMILIKKVPKI